MSFKEIKERESKDWETPEQDILVAGEEKEEMKNMQKLTEQEVIADDKITILKHGIYRNDDGTTRAVYIDLVIKNISDITLGSVLFEAELYDVDGNILDILVKKMFEFRPGTTSNLRIDYSGAESAKVNSYRVKVARIILTPEPIVTGNESIKILKHNLNRGMTGRVHRDMPGIDFCIRNVSDSTIARILFEGMFYDIEGNLLDSFKREELELKPDTSRAVTIKSMQHDLRVKSYNVRIARMTLADVERIQLRHHEIRTTDNGEEEVRGIIKNISNETTDTALIATFFDSMKEKIGTKVTILRDIEPSALKQFHFLFKPQNGDIVSTYAMSIGEIIE